LHRGIHLIATMWWWERINCYGFRP